jgi:predicted Fe-Mo cluster-binding NifX family protein
MLSIALERDLFMKIAVASTDGVSVSQHFGQSAGFIVFDIEGASIKSHEWRPADQSPHSAGICQHEQGEAASHQGGSAHDHAGFMTLIHDCETILCGGMGAGAAQAMVQYGFRPVVVPVSGTAEKVVAQYLEGAIVGSESPSCQCHH